LSEKKLAANDPESLAARRDSARRSRRDFLVLGAGAFAAYEFYHSLSSARMVELLPAPLRGALDWNHSVSEALFHDRVLAPTYPVSKSVELRINGNYGLKQDLHLDSYRLQVVGVEQDKSHPRYVADVTAWQYRYAADEAKYEGHDTKVKPTEGEQKPKDDVAAQFAAGMAAAEAANRDGRPPRGNEEAGPSDSTLDPGTPGLLLTLDDLARLPKQDLVTQFKCIEGWSEIVHWGGYRMADFIAAYPPSRNAQGSLPRYVYMETPNGDYYTGYELHECMHPQTLLATEMAGKPLSQAHGAPLRLHMPIKYGYKQLKRIALIAYTDEKPDDYWTKLGYDWYAGL
jgi:hypothetical protein